MCRAKLKSKMGTAEVTIDKKFPSCLPPRNWGVHRLTAIMDILRLWCKTFKSDALNSESHF